MSTPYGIYVHVPWCRARCPYCAFNVYVSDNPPYTEWKNGVLSGWEKTSSSFSGKAHSLYFGGGTPSLAPPETLAKIIDTLPLEADAEITMEANPGSTDRAGLQAFRDVGINRLSLGVQTWNPVHARSLGRGHTISQTQQLLEQVTQIGFQSWSIDLMFALPNQTMDELEADLNQVLALSPPHVSLYGLTIEPNTPFAQSASTGRLSVPQPEAWRAQYDRIRAVLTANGWEQYEVSNYAQPGHRSRHNEQVWRGGHYAGLGPGAHGFQPNGERTICAKEWDEWRTHPAPVHTRPSDLDAAADYVLSSLRHVDGIELDALRTKGYTVQPEVLQNLNAHGLITFSQTTVQIQPDAFPLADGIVRHIIDAIEPFSTA